MHVALALLIGWWYKCNKSCLKSRKWPLTLKNKYLVSKASYCLCLFKIKITSSSTTSIKLPCKQFLQYIIIVNNKVVVAIMNYVHVMSKYLHKYMSNGINLIKYILFSLSVANCFNDINLFIKWINYVE